MNIEELKKQRKVKILLEGNTGSGKTFTALLLSWLLSWLKQERKLNILIQSMVQQSSLY